MWQVARDAFLRYIDSEQFGSGKFAEFMEETLAADEGGRGPRNLFHVRGATFRVASQANKRYALDQRAEMRGRLVMAAMHNKLEFGQAALAGFAADAAVTINVDEYDESE